MSIGRLLLSAFFIVVFFAGPAVSQTSERETEGAGTWRPGAAEADGAQCKRIWHCTSDVNIPLKDNEEVFFSAIVRTDGHCADNECKKCAAPEPTQSCTWRIVQQQ